MAILAAAVGRWLGVPTLRFLGDPFIQYGDALKAPEATSDHVARAWHAIRDARVASFAWLRKVRADAHLSQALTEGGTVIGADAAPYIDLGKPAGKLGARKLRRSREKLAEHGEVVFGVSGGEAAKPWLDRALQLKREWMAARGLTNRVVGDPFWEGAFGALTQQDGPMKLVAAHLSCGGKPVAIEIAFAFGNRWYSYLTATEPDYAKYSTGQLQIVDAIKHAQDAGFEVYDFLGPAYPHKTQFTDTQVGTNDFGIALDVTGFAGLYAAQMIPSVKARVLSLPPGLRRFIFRNAGNETA
nr:GNAT family N-acetyltransferase [Variibacter gotjawalensis]